MNLLTRNVLLCATWIPAVAGCHSKKDLDTSNLKTAISSYYSAHPVCVWTNPVKFPAQADASNDSQTKSFDALTDAGLLTRGSEEKKRFLIGSKQVTNYDVSEKGRSVWSPDSSQPGYGNFCYGHREVTSIDTLTTSTDQNGNDTASVNYHYQIAGAPDWAQASETKTAFPNVQEALAGQQTSTAKLVHTQNGWQLTQ